MLKPPGDWSDQGICAQVDGDLWFQEKGNTATTALAKRICWDRCAVREQCLEWAMESDEEFGVFGGFTAKERKKLRQVKAA